jgi:NNP family nitrate/nitrite transporter-like MFS transporter
VAGLAGVTQAGGALAAGWGVGRFGGARVQLASSALVVVGVAALIASVPALPLLPFLYALIASTGRGCIPVAVTSVVRQRFGGPSFGAASGMAEIGVGLGGFTGTWLVGLLVDWTGSYIPGLLSAIAVAVALAGFTLAGALAPLRR